MSKGRYDPTDLLTIDEVAEYLDCSRRTVERMKDLPWSWLNKRTRRMLFGNLVEHLKAKAAA